MSDLETRFKELAKVYEEETRFLSFTKRDHPAMVEVIALGPEAVPIILRHMRDSNPHWFYAVAAITGAAPVKDENRGRVRLMVEDWLRWGREQGHDV